MFGGNNCVNKIAGCDKYDNDKCVKCKKAFKEANGGCSIEHCQKVGADGCEKCEQNFDLVHGGCVLHTQPEQAKSHPSAPLSGPASAIIAIKTIFELVHMS